MKIRILSDLHLSINKDFPLEIPNNYDYTLIAGDLGPDYKNNVKWIRKNIHQGAFISGNHDAYTFDNTVLEDVKNFYHKEFPLDSDITYFDNDVGVISKEISENILLVADVLYTDYSYPCYPDEKKLPLDVLVCRNKARAVPKMSGSYMNDFRFFTRNGKYEKDSYSQLPDGIFYLKPENYIEHFEKAFKNITEIVEKNKDKDIILMTHHCLSPKCCSKYMYKDSLMASYVMNKESWIKKHPNIKMIVSGHVHNERVFHVGKTLYVMNPLGYCKNNHDIHNHGKKSNRWTQDFFVDTNSWTVEKNEYNNNWEKQHELENKKFEKYSGFFI